MKVRNISLPHIKPVGKLFGTASFCTTSDPVRNYEYMRRSKQCNRSVAATTTNDFTDSFF
jgi:hypothetical protein